MASMVTSRPLMLESKLRWVCSQMSPASWSEITKYPEWLESAARVEAASRLTTAWLRSRLPGYPDLLTPELVSNGPLATDEFSFEIPWSPMDRRLGLQLQNPPRQIGELLGASNSLGTSIEAAMRALASHVRTTDEWSALAEARAGLTQDDRDQLAASRREAASRLVPEQVDAYEPDLAVRRAEYRRVVVDEALGSLSGTAAAYASAFSRANGLLNRMAVEVFGQLVCFEVPTLRIDNAELKPGRVQNVRFEGKELGMGVVLLQPGSVAWLDDSLIKDAVIVVATSIQWERTGAETVTFDAEILSGTATGWRPAP